MIIDIGVYCPTQERAQAFYATLTQNVASLFPEAHLRVEFLHVDPAEDIEAAPRQEWLNISFPEPTLETALTNGLQALNMAKMMGLSL